MDDKDTRIAALEAELDVRTRERDWMKDQLERERLRLAACGVVALANTRESALNAREFRDEYASDSCTQIARAVDREMDERERREAAEAVLRYIAAHSDNWDDDVDDHFARYPHNYDKD